MKKYKVWKGALHQAIEQKGEKEKPVIFQCWNFHIPVKANEFQLEK